MESHHRSRIRGVTAHPGALGDVGGLHLARHEVMNIEPPPDTEETRAVAEKATAEIARKWKARQRVPAGRLGFVPMGLVGWTIVLPMLLAATLGHWLDAHHPASFSWMFALPVAALAIGSVNAAYWAYAGRRAAASLPE